MWMAHIFYRRSVLLSIEGHESPLKETSSMGQETIKESKPQFLRAPRSLFFMVFCGTLIDN